MQCVAGKYKKIQGAGYCRSCSQGSHAASAGAASCALCEAGSYADIAGSTICSNCTSGTYQEGLGATTCLACPIGTYANSGSAVGQKNSTACFQCAGGKYSNVTGATSAKVCVDCEPATYALAGSSRCIECPVGKYASSQAFPGSHPSYCLHCNPGKVSSNVGALSEATCVECHAGINATLFKLDLCIRLNFLHTRLASLRMYSRIHLMDGSVLDRFVCLEGRADGLQGLFHW